MSFPNRRMALLFAASTRDVIHQSYRFAVDWIAPVSVRAGKPALSEAKYSTGIDDRLLWRVHHF
jgi:hypothetical protein